MITILTSSVAVLAIGVALYTYRKLRMLAKAFAHLMMATSNLAEVAKEQQNVNDLLKQSLTNVDTNLEILGVHTKLIPPTIGFEATQFLAWHNKKKEENNG